MKRLKEIKIMKGRVVERKRQGNGKREIKETKAEREQNMTREAVDDYDASGNNADDDNEETERQIQLPVSPR
jgi:hypothetical protein